MIGIFKKRYFRYSTKDARITSQIELTEEQVSKINEMVQSTYKYPPYNGCYLIAREIVYYIGKDKCNVQYAYRRKRKSIVKIFKNT